MGGGLVESALNATETLTTQAVLTMPAGRKMDLLVHERAMGAKYAPPESCPDCGGCLIEDRRLSEHLLGGKCLECYRYHGGVPNYSTDMNDAWLVVGAMMARHTQDFFFSGYAICQGCDWRFAFSDKRDGVFSPVAGKGDTAALAICRAALMTTIPE